MKPKTRRVVRLVAPLTVAGAVGVGVIHHEIKNSRPATWESRNHALVEMARARNFNGYDMEAMRTVGSLRKNVLPIAARHWNAITNIAGTNFNTLAVLDTLSRVTPDRGDIAGSDYPRIAHMNSQINRTYSASGSTEANLNRADIFRRAIRLGGPAKVEKMMADLQEIPSSELEWAREVFYGGDAAHGALRSGSHTNKVPALKPASTNSPPRARLQRGLDPKSQRIAAKSRR